MPNNRNFTCDSQSEKSIVVSKNSDDYVATAKPPVTSIDEIEMEIHAKQSIMRGWKNADKSIFLLPSLSCRDIWQTSYFCCGIVIITLFLCYNWGLCVTDFSLRFYCCEIIDGKIAKKMWNLLRLVELANLQKKITKFNHKVSLNLWTQFQPIISINFRVLEITRSRFEKKFQNLSSFSLNNFPIKIDANIRLVIPPDLFIYLLIMSRENGMRLRIHFLSSSCDCLKGSLDYTFMNLL